MKGKKPDHGVARENRLAPAPYTELAIALGLILLTISLAITMALRFFQRLGRTGTTGSSWV